MSKKVKSLANYEWIVVFFLITVMIVLTKMALNAPFPRWPTKDNEPAPLPEEQVVISISGELESPGRYHFAKGTTLKQALSKIKLTENAEIEHLKLDQALKKGQKVRIPKRKNSKKRLEKASESVVLKK